MRAAAQALFATTLLGWLLSCGGGGRIPSRAPLPAAAWPVFRGDAGHRGDRGQAPTPRGVLRWRAAVGGRVDASPLVDGLGRIVVANRQGKVVVLAAADGAIVAQAQLPAGVWATPAIVGDTLVVAAKDGRLHGLDSERLEPRWSLAVGKGALSASTVIGDRLLLCADEQLLALDAAAKARPVIAWRRALGARCYTAPVFDPDHDAVLVGDRSGTVTSLALADGSVRWRNAPTPGVAIDGSGALGTEVVYFGGNDGALRAYDLRSGSVRFSVVGAAWVVSTPAVLGERVIYGDDDGVLRAIAADGSAQHWQAHVGGDIASSPTLVGELVVHAAHDGRLYGREPTTGALRFSVDLGAAAYATVAVLPAGGVVIATHGGDVLVID